MTAHCRCGSAADGVCTHCGRPACTWHAWSRRPTGERRYYDHDTGLIAVEPVYSSPLPPGHWRGDQQTAMFEAVGARWGAETFLCRECVEPVMIAAAGACAPAEADQPSLARRVEHALRAGDTMEWHSLTGALRDAWALDGETRRLVMRFIHGASRGVLGPEHRCGLEHRPYRPIAPSPAYAGTGGAVLRAHWGVDADGQIIRCEQRAAAIWTGPRRMGEPRWWHSPDEGTHIARYVEAIELVERELTAGSHRARGRGHAPRRSAAVRASRP